MSPRSDERMSTRPEEDDLTTLLNRWSERDEQDFNAAGDHEAAVHRLYEQCRNLVRRVKRRSSSLTGLDTTDVLHRAWERTMLAKGDHPAERRWASRGQFFAFIARATVESIIDEARFRRAAKRGGAAVIRSASDLPQLSIDHRRGDGDGTADEETRIALRQALDEFAIIDPRACMVLTMQHFWGFSAAELAASLGITERTVFRDARAARVWVARRMHRLLGTDGAAGGEGSGGGK